MDWVSLNTNSVTTPEVAPPPRNARTDPHGAVVGRHQATVGEHHVGSDQVVDREAVFAGGYPARRPGRPPTRWWK